MFDTRDTLGDTPRDDANREGHNDGVVYLDNLVIAIDNVRDIVCLLIGMRKKGSGGDFQLFPKDIVLMIAKHVWATRRDIKWLEALPKKKKTKRQKKRK